MTSGWIIHKIIPIDAPVSKVWELLTNTELMKQWLFDTETYVSTDWKQGSPIVFRGDFLGKEYESKGIILQREPEQLLQYTYWSSLSEIPDVTENYSLIEFSLATTENGTLLTFTQSNFKLETMYKHSEMYWNVTLQLVKSMAEKPE